MYVSPTVVGDLLYIGSCSGIYYAFDRSSGEVVWSHDTATDGTAASFHGDPLIVGDLLLTGSDHTLGGKVYAFDRTTGEVRWMRDVGGLETDLVPSGGNALGGTSDGSLIALDIATGEPAWSFSTESLRSLRAFALTPVVDGDRVYYGGRDGTVYALSAPTGDVLWSREVGGEISTPTRLVDAHLYVGTYEKELIRLDPESGTITARLSTERWPHHSLVSGGECLVVLLGDPVAACVDLALEEVRWSESAQDWSDSAGEEWTAYNPLVLDDVVILGSGSGKLVAVRLTDGSIAWSTELEGMLRGLGTSRGILYVGTLGGTVYALELSPGDSLDSG